MRPMHHQRHYTVEQANAVREWVATRVGWSRDAHARLVALGPRVGEAVGLLDNRSGGSYPGRDVARSLVELSRALGELDAVEVVLRDIDRGLVDFPAIQPDGSGAAHECVAGCPARGTPEGREIYLCWLVDEPEIGFWHEPEAGFAGRRPL